MPTLKENIENRVRKLPKPSNHAQALQPIFEAISNSLFAVEDRYGASSMASGLVEISLTKLSAPTNLKISVSDNGIGLDQDRYDAFCEVDTDFKSARGGKGVGRLFWLDAFKSISVESNFEAGGKNQRRAFKFNLANENQIVPEALEETSNPAGTIVSFDGVRNNTYAKHFPKKSDTFLRYFGAHFIADFLVGNGAKVVVEIGGKKTYYSKQISDLVIERKEAIELPEQDDFGILKLAGFVCKAEASTGLEGNHQLHLLADGRTVETRKVDSLLGLKHLKIGDEDELVFHGCVSGEFLNERVNEGRTAFNLTEKTINDICRLVVEATKTQLLADQIADYESKRLTSYRSFVAKHPIYGFDVEETQLRRVPFNAMKAEEFAAGLVKYQIRRDEERQSQIESVIQAIEGGERLPDDFADKVASTAKEMQESERLALAHHVARRKLVLELFGKLQARIRKTKEGVDSFHLEKTLHSLIVPMYIKGDDSMERKPRSHDLWIVDERLNFTRAFASDKRFASLMVDNDNEDRSDLIIWDLAFGLGITDSAEDESINVSEPLKKIMIVEFKRPGRKSYPKVEDQIETQITKYLTQLKSGEIESFGNERIRIADDCVFHCYVIADIVGDLETQLSTWRTTANGEGRLRELNNKFSGTIEVIQWNDLANDAWVRNSALMQAAGFSRQKPLLEER